MITEIFLIGLVAGFLFYELTGISPGGVIGPAYFALFVLQPGKIAMTIILSLIVYLIIKYLSSYLVIYGRRKLLLALLLSFLFKLIIDLYLQPLSMVKLDLQSIGYIIPGLVANEMTRQKIAPTLLSLGIVTILTYQIAQFL
ncbi:MAG: poly-gamma-glutamate biosynthesis protein PgsC [Bacteroidota bacterium]